MPYAIPTPPTTGMVSDPDGVVWTRGTNDIWSADCPTCRTHLGSMSWPDLLEAKVTLNDVPAGLAAGGPA